jgi:hypothetical protein
VVVPEMLSHSPGGVCLQRTCAHNACHCTAANTH